MGQHRCPNCGESISKWFNSFCSGLYGEPKPVNILYKISIALGLGDVNE